jgi:hypothetical protein
VYDIAWKKPEGSPLSATRYIPLTGFDAHLHTNESTLYDLAHFRAVPWSDFERTADPNGWGTAASLREPYESWGVELPEYYASRIDDIALSSDWAIDWLIKQLEGGASGMTNRAEPGSVSSSGDS